MGIIKEFYDKTKSGVSLYKTYSDNGYVIQKVGTDEIYEEAIDLETSTFEYIETDIKIEQ